MIDFNFSYDCENDDLFVYLEGKKSEGAVELGNFILDFDSKGNLVSFEIIDASKTLAKIMPKVIELSKITQMKVEIINFRNIDAIKFKIITLAGEASANILIPHITEQSPVLIY